jgi:acyl carrier protein
MNVQEAIYQLILNEGHTCSSIDEYTDLFKDLSFDSLSFVSMLVKIEEMFAIIFDITEMESCLVVGRLVEIVKEKMGRD